MFNVPTTTPLGAWQREFEAWKSKVTAIMIHRSGMAPDDLPDWRYADAFNEGMPASEAVREALQAAMDYY